MTQQDLEYRHTSLELSKLLQGNNCKIESKYVWFHHSFTTFKNAKRLKQNYIKNYGKKYQDKGYKIYPAYDLIWDICIKHARDFFGEVKELGDGWKNNPPYCRGIKILDLLQQDKKPEAEKLIIENCLFFRK